MKHFIILLFCIPAGLLSGCTSRFLKVQDIPPYEDPEISIPEAQKEIALLKKQKDRQKQKIKTLRNT